MYHLGKDLGWDWISASYLIKYAHNGWSCDLVFELGILRAPRGIPDKTPGFCWIPMFVFFLIFFMRFLIKLGALSWQFGVRTITPIIFIRFQIFLVHLSLGLRSWMEWISESYLIRYAHNGWSCDFLILGSPKLNFWARAFKFGMVRALKGIPNIKIQGFAEFQYLYILWFFF